MTELRRAAGASRPDDLDCLTAREAEILELVAAGMTNAAIAERPWVSPGSVKKHLENVCGSACTGPAARRTRFR